MLTFQFHLLDSFIGHISLTALQGYSFQFHLLDSPILDRSGYPPKPFRFQFHLLDSYNNSDTGICIGSSKLSIPFIGFMPLPSPREATHLPHNTFNSIYWIPRPHPPEELREGEVRLSIPFIGFSFRCLRMVLEYVVETFNSIYWIRGKGKRGLGKV